MPAVGDLDVKTCFDLFEVSIVLAAQPSEASIILWGQLQCFWSRDGFQV